MEEGAKQPRITVSITKEELASLPMASYPGNVVVVESEEQAIVAVSDLRTSDVIGFDTETRPSFRKGVINKVALMQLSTRKCCYLFRLNKIGMPQCLRELLEDAEQLKVGLSIHDDFHNIRNLCGKFVPAGFIELQGFVKNYSIADNSLARIYAILFGLRISKGQRLTNWEADELTSNQQRYAALDALACIQIYDWVTQGRFTPELSPYMHEEQEEERLERERLEVRIEDEVKNEAKAEVKRRRRKAQRQRRKARAAAEKLAGKKGLEE